MMRIKIIELPKDSKISKGELKKIRGGNRYLDIDMKMKSAQDQFSTSCILAVAQCVSVYASLATVGIGSGASSAEDATKPTK
jgi:hypothetical protein